MANKKQTTDESILNSIRDVLIDHPDLAEGVAAILKIANEPRANGTNRSADEVELLLIEELRKLGNESLFSWAEGRDNQLGEELKSERPGSKMREKNSRVVDSFRFGSLPGEPLA
jgi:hypothetical protein